MSGQNMAQQVRVLAARPGGLGLTPAPARWKGTAKSYQLSSDLHTQLRHNRPCIYSEEININQRQTDRENGRGRGRKGKQENKFEERKKKGK